MTVNGYDLVFWLVYCILYVCLSVSIERMVSVEHRLFGLACCGENLSGEIFGFSLPLKYGLSVITPPVLPVWPGYHVITSTTSTTSIITD